MRLRRFSWIDVEDGASVNRGSIKAKRVEKGKSWRSAGMEKKVKEFEPHRWLRNGHAQTMAGAFVRRTFAMPKGEERLFRVDAETQVKGVCHWQPGKPRDLPVIVVVHGLEGSCDSHYSRGIANKAWARGFHAVRMNQRNCGGTEGLTPTLYNSGLSGDYRAVLLQLMEEGFEEIFFVGYSMGGNLVTKMAGELGVNAPKELKGVAVVCPALDLSACADALEKRSNYLYQRHFVKNLMARYGRKAELFPERYRRDGFGTIRTVREFDNEITAPCFGFEDAEEYYRAASAKKVIGKVVVPLLVLTAQDDPFVPYELFLRVQVEENSCVRFVAPAHGGHCGFISRFAGAERFWAEERIAEFVEQRSKKARR
jgi:predicted alpha/beta-fold hydrolase